MGNKPSAPPPTPPPIYFNADRTPNDANTYGVIVRGTLLV